MWITCEYLNILLGLEIKRQALVYVRGLARCGGAGICVEGGGGIKQKSPAITPGSTKQILRYVVVVN
jgi:hypothetical protein